GYTIRAPVAVLFPYTTLFRSHSCRQPFDHNKDRRNPDFCSSVRVASLAIKRFQENLPIGCGRFSSYCSDLYGELRPFPFNLKILDRKSTRLNSSHVAISYAVL